MSAADKLGGYAAGFGNLDAEAIAENVATDFKLLDKDGGDIVGAGMISFGEEGVTQEQLFYF